MNYGVYGKPPPPWGSYEPVDSQRGIPTVSKYGNYTVVDKVLADMLDLVNEHWYHFPPMNPLWHSILGFVMTIFTIVALIGNGVVIYVFITTKSLRTPPNMLVLNLALSDFFMMFTMGPPMIINCYYETWVLGPLICQLYGMAGALFGTGSIWTMTMIALDRYNIIVKGFTAKPLTFLGSFIRILGIWSFAGIATAIPMFGWNKYVPEGNMTSCGFDYLNTEWISKSFICVYAFCAYFTPLSIILYSYFFIVKAVFNHEREMKEQAKKMNVASLRSQTNDTSAEIKLAKIALMTISLWFMAWTPYLVINFTGIYDPSKLSPLGTIWGSTFAKAMAMYNPIVYGISHPKYRAALLKKFPSLACAAPIDSNEVDEKSQTTTAVYEDA